MDDVRNLFGGPVTVEQSKPARKKRVVTQHWTEEQKIIQIIVMAQILANTPSISTTYSIYKTARSLPPFFGANIHVLQRRKKAAEALIAWMNELGVEIRQK